MKETRVAKRYAAALFEVAKRDDIVDAIGEDLSLVERMFKESERLHMMFTQPLMTDERKSKLIANVFGDRVTATSLNFLKLLIHKRRTDIVHEIVEEFRSLLLEHLNIVDAAAQTAVAMTPDQLDKLTKSLVRMTGKKVNLTTEVCPELIGGVIVRIGDDIIDGSLRGRLQRLEQHMLGNRATGGSV